MPTLQELIQVDSTPLDTDWNDIHELFADMERFAKENQKHVFLCADDPGTNHTPRRVPRLGWVAYLEQPDEQSKMWTITIRSLLSTLRRKPSRFDLSDRQGMLGNLRTQA